MAERSTARAGGLESLVELRRALTRAGLVFGSLAVVVVMAFGTTGGERAQRFADIPPGVDDMITGSIGTGERYVVTRSVLQAPGAPPCILFQDGTRRGAC